MKDFPLLSIIIFLPLFAALSLLFIRNNNEASIKTSRKMALIFAFIEFLLSTLLVFNFDKKEAGFQFVEKYVWIKKFNINYHLGIDGISLFFIILTSFLTIICILASWENVKIRVKEYLLSFLILEALVIGVFSSLDFILFYIFFEAMLIPMFLIIGIWGGNNRIYAAYKFFLYTLAGSLFLLLGIIYIYYQTGSMNIVELMVYMPKFSLTIQKYLWLAFLASFAVKVPMWPFHTWLPDAHVQAPTAGSIILAGVLLKLGAYGFLRFSLPMLPAASHYFQELIYIISIVGVIYASLVALVQKDIKKLIAYSSIAHMGFVTAGIFAFNEQAITGAIVQMVSHGIVSGGLFFSIGVIYDRMHTREISSYGGIVEVMPIYAFIMMVFTMAAIGLPGTSGFIGEFLVIGGTFKSNQIVSAFIALGMVLGATYMLLLYKKAIFGEPNDKVILLKDLNFREVMIYIPLILLIMIIGIYPKIITDYLEISVANLINQINCK
ncbi:MAG: NADH-quinone oxidoreductase subunit M [Alphaproteobacteria bacterium]